MELKNMNIQQLLAPEGFECRCGKTHCALPLRSLLIEQGALNKLAGELRKLEVDNIFVVMGNNSQAVVGQTVTKILEKDGFEFSQICLHGRPKVLPNEVYLDIVSAACPENARFVLGVGSGVINDLCKMIASARGIPCGIVATAPSMDGYASNSSAMELGGIKTTVYTTCPSLIVCDTDILREAPFEMLSAGFGDMAAKLISIADWKIASLITGEYYCEEIAEMMTKAYSVVVCNVNKIARRDEEAIRHMTEGLVLSGIAMSMAKVSRPASGMEHTISHILEMLAIARGAQGSLHGLQVGYGVREALELYEKASSFTPTKTTCQAAADGFDEAAWEREMKTVFGKQAEELIARAKEEERNAPQNILKRGLSAAEHWSEIKKVIEDVLSQKDAVNAALDKMNIPTLGEIEKLGYTKTEARAAVEHSRNLRARYIFTSMCFDIGLNE